MTVLRNARVVTPDEVLEDGWISLNGDRIVDLGVGTDGGSGSDQVVDLAGGIVVPGFVDTHVHGGGGGSYLAAEEDEARRVAAFHRARGTTTTFASLITAPPAHLERQLRGLAGLVDDQTLAGIHLEGPWLSAAKCGAHDPSLLRTPTADEVARLLDVGDGTVRMVTLAPELDEGLAAISRLVDAGVVAAVGHTAATYEVVRAALDRGATVGTHLFNAMPAIHHREPGPVVALLEDPRVLIEVIADGIHLHAGVVGLAARAAGIDRLGLVTDAMTAAGVADGSYELGGQAVQVTDGIARLAESGSIAGSTLTMDAAFRFAVDQAGLSLVEAARAASTNPARAHGMDDAGALRAGFYADLVVLDEQLRVIAVMRRGAWVSDPTAPEMTKHDQG